MNRTAFFALAHNEVRLFRRDPVGLLVTFLLPLALLVISTGSGPEAPAVFGGDTVFEVVVPGLVALGLATYTMMDLPGALAEERERGVLRLLRVFRVPATTVVGGHAAVAVAVSLTAALAVAVVAVMLGAPLPEDPAAVLLASVVATLSLLAVAVAVGYAAPSARTAKSVAAAIYFPMIFLSGAAAPRESLPEAAQRVGDALPLTYAVEALRDGWTGRGVDAGALVVLAAVLTVAAIAAARAFRWD